MTKTSGWARSRIDKSPGSLVIAARCHRGFLEIRVEDADGRDISDPIVNVAQGGDDMAVVRAIRNALNDVLEAR